MKNSISQDKCTLGSVQAWMIWLLSVSFTIWVHVIQTGYAIFNPQLQASIGLSIQQVGFAAAVYPCTAAILQLFTGNLMDQLGPGKTIVPAVFCVTFGAFLLSHAGNYSMLLCAQIILATGACFGFAGAGYITSAWFHKHHFGLIFGIVQVLLSFSVAFGQLGFNCLLKTFHWREILACFFQFGIGLSILSVLFMRAPAHIRYPEFNGKYFLLKTVLRSAYVLKQREVILCVIHGGIVYGFIWALGVVWLPKLIVAHELPIDIANYSVSGLWMGVAIGSLMVDRLWKWFRSTQKILIFFLIIQFVSLFAILYFQLTNVTAITLSILFGFGASSHMLTYTIGKNAVPGQYSGSAISIVNGFMFFIGAVFVAIIGAYLESTELKLHDYQGAAVIFWGGMIIALISGLFFRDNSKNEKVPALAAGL